MVRAREVLRGAGALGDRGCMVPAHLHCSRPPFWRAAWVAPSRSTSLRGVPDLLSHHTFFASKLYQGCAVHVFSAVTAL